MITISGVLLVLAFSSMRDDSDEKLIAMLREAQSRNSAALKSGKIRAHLEYTRGPG